uniref:Putative RusA superfamily protein n=1 Tax=Hot spring virus BHS2 TaxID=2024352 RepID=A0A2Y9CIC7_9VIRU|nr:putative RusA superfamily protein [Hot spring virus BHS2]
MPTLEDRFEAFTLSRLKSATYFSLKHWSYRHRDRNYWLREVSAMFGKPKGEYEHIVLQITRILGKQERQYDEDNLRYGSAKQIVDAFVRLGWVPDDNPNYVTVEVAQVKDQRDKPGTLIRVIARRRK